MILHKVMENIGESLDEYSIFFSWVVDHFYDYKFIFSVFFVLVGLVEGSEFPTTHSCAVPHTVRLSEGNY